MMHFANAAHLFVWFLFGYAPYSACTRRSLRTWPIIIRWFLGMILAFFSWFLLVPAVCQLYDLAYWTERTGEMMEGELQPPDGPNFFVGLVVYGWVPVFIATYVGVVRQPYLVAKRL
jgi:hypothetical protein